MRIKYDHLYPGEGTRSDDPRTPNQIVDLLIELYQRPITLYANAYVAMIEATPGRVFIAIDQDADVIVGIAVINFLSTFTGYEARLDEVVVHADYRGHKIGHELCVQAIAYAKEMGADEIELTSKPIRKAAHALYTSLGFKKRDTCVFKLSLEKEPE